MKRMAARLHHYLYFPGRILLFCFGFAFLSLTFNGGWARLYTLNRDRQRMLNESKELLAEMTQLRLRLKQAQDPAFIEREARDKYEFAEENDLIFVFPDEG